MKKIILLSLTLLLSALCLRGQQTLYVIDNVTVENFDGSQLKGKNVKDYQITTTGKGSKAVTVHAITTAPSAFSFSGDFPKIDLKNFTLPDFSGKDLKDYADSISVLGNTFIITQEKPLYIIDGKRTSDESALRDLSASQIKRVTVLKNTEATKLYGTTQPVIVVETKNMPDGLLDLLQKSPGVKVGEDGSISANGESVQKITITGTTYKKK